MSRRGSSRGSSGSQNTVLTDKDKTGSKDNKDKPVSPSGHVDATTGASSLESIVSKGAPTFQRRFWEAARKARKQLKRAKKTSEQEYRRERSKVLLKATPAQWKSKSARAKTCFPVDKLKDRLRMSTPNHVTVQTDAAVAIAAGLDYCQSELLDVASKAADLKKQSKVTPRHIKLGVPQDESLAELFRDVTIPQGGVVPHFHPELAMGYRKTPKRSYQPDVVNKDKKEGSSPIKKDKISPASAKDKGDVSSLSYSRAKKKKDSSDSPK